MVQIVFSGRFIPAGITLVSIENKSIPALLR
jgi:hypothetical protein